MVADPQSVPVLADQALRACRLGMDGMAGDRLARLIDRLQQDLPRLPPAVLQTLAPCLAEMLAAQERQDLVGVADLLEYCVGPLLSEAMDTEGKPS